MFIYAFLIPNVYFILLIAFFTAYLTFLTAKGGLTDNRYKKLWKRLTKRGKLVSLVLLIISVLLIAQELALQKKNRLQDKEIAIEKKKNDSILKKEQIIKDSVIAAEIKKGVDSSSKKLFEDISKAFANQSLQLDTVNKSIEKIKSSAKAVTNNFGQEDPTIGIHRNGIQPTKTENLNTYYDVAIFSENAGSTNFDIPIYLIIQYLDGSVKYIDKTNTIPKKLRIGKNNEWIMGYHFFDISKINIIYFYLKGAYTTLDGLKSYNIDDLYELNVRNNETLISIDSRRNKILRLIPSKELN